MIYIINERENKHRQFICDSFKFLLMLRFQKPAPLTPSICFDVECLDVLKITIQTVQMYELNYKELPSVAAPMKFSFKYRNLNKLKIDSRKHRRV